MWFLVQGFEVRNYGKITYALCSQVIFATMSNRKEENFFYIAVGEF
jgi:hypothetical protein